MDFDQKSWLADAAAFDATCKRFQVPSAVERSRCGNGALVVSAALEAGCTMLYSEDLHDGQTIDGQLTIRNPFVGSSASQSVVLPAQT